jgi:hypothetical protein
MSDSILAKSDKVIQEIYSKLGVRSYSFNDHIAANPSDLPKLIRTNPSGFYWPYQDVVALRDGATESNILKINCIVVHELIHWTGRNGRTPRFGIDYVTEEMVAEHGTVYLLGRLGLLDTYHENRLHDKVARYGNQVDMLLVRMQASCAVEWILQKSGVEEVA